MSGNRVAITLTVTLEEGANVYEAAEQVFDLVAADPDDWCPLVAVAESFDVKPADA